MKRGFGVIVRWRNKNDAIYDLKCYLMRFTECTVALQFSIYVEFRGVTGGVPEDVNDVPVDFKVFHGRFKAFQGFYESF